MKGVFCLEGFWYGDHRDATSVSPILELIHRYRDMPFTYHRCATVEEFTFSLKRWKTKAFHKKYPILYLAFHGETGCIKLGNKKISLDELAELLGDKCEGSMIYFGSCATMDIDKRKLQSFMEKTKTVAMLGYKQDVDWLLSASFEILLLSLLLNHPFDSKGVKEIYEEIMENCKSQVRQLQFRMVPNERIWFPRKRTVKKV